MKKKILSFTLCLVMAASIGLTSQKFNANPNKNVAYSNTGVIICSPEDPTAG